MYSLIPAPDSLEQHKELCEAFSPVLHQAREVDDWRIGRSYLGNRKSIWLPYPVEIRPKTVDLYHLERPKFMRIFFAGEAAYDISFGNTSTEEVDVITIELIDGSDDFKWMEWTPSMALSSTRESDQETIQTLVTDKLVPHAISSIRQSISPRSRSLQTSVNNL